MRNVLYYGDNLPIMREHIADESVDLVYLDPPFNSARDYNVLFKQAKRDENQAQITAFTDTWQWSKRRYEEFFDDSRNGRGQYCNQYGWNEPGHWEIGTYEVTIYVNKRKVASDHFEIY